MFDSYFFYWCELLRTA